MGSKPGFYKNVYFLLKGNMLFQVITILTLMVVTRFYTTEEIGEYVVFCSIATIVGNVSTGRLELALMIPISKQETENIFLTGVKFSFITSVIVLIFSLLIIFFNQSGWVYIILPLGIYTLGITLLQAQLLNKNEQFKEVGKGKVLFGLVTSFIHIFVFYTIGNNVYILIAGYLIGLLCMSFYYWFHLKNIVNFKIINNSIFKSTLKANKSFPTINNIGSLFNLLANQGPVVLIESFFGGPLAAFYSVVQKSLNAPSSLLSRAFSDVFFKKVTDGNSTQKQIKNFVKINLKYFAILILIGFSIIFIFGDFLYVNLFGEKYIESSKIAKITILFFMTRFAVTSLNSIVIAKGWLKLDLRFNLFLFLSQITPILVGHYIFDMQILTIILLMTILGVLAYFYLGFLVYSVINQKEDF